MPGEIRGVRMKKQYILIMSICLMLTGCGDYDPSYMQQDQAELDQYLEESFVREDFAKVRDIAESYVARFPMSPTIDDVRIKLLVSYIKTRKYKLAELYSKRLLSGSLLRESYHEDAKYYQIVLSVERSKQWLKRKVTENCHMNTGELAGVYQVSNKFLEQYPDSQYYDQVLKIKLELMDVLAKQELALAKHYLDLGNTDAATKHLAKQKKLYPEVDVEAELSAFSHLE